MAKVRVLVVDDAVVVRRLVANVLAADPGLEVVATAPNGRVALAKIPQVHPDLVTLDVDMPEMDGLETLATLRKLYPRLPVIMFSSLTQKGAAATLDALALGANDYVAKPSGAGGMEAALQQVRGELIPRIKALCQRPAGVEIPRVPAPRGPVRRAPERVELLAIGVSTGGPNALHEVLPQLPASFPVPTVIVQHMPPLFTRLLAERLDARSAIAVHEGTAGSVLKPAQAWVAPGGHHMEVAGDGAKAWLRLHEGPPENSCRPAVDVLFRSAAETYGPGVLAVVLTGMGQDGLRGSERVHAAGGQVLAQDEASSVVWGMPGFVARAGLADQLLPLGQMASEIVRRVRVGREQRGERSGSCP